MVYEYYPITGIQTGRGPNGSVPVRQEIDAWSSKPENSKQVNLYLLALRRLQDVPPDKRDSWFQIAGIHGMPYTGWDEPNTTAADAKNKGYCTHANPLFPPWHRPYLMLLENQLYDIMVKEIVPKVPEKDRVVWQQAANTWRLPFWDWAANPRVPKLAYQPEVTVTMPDGVVTKIENPLYQYRMPTGKPMESMGVGSIKGDEGVELAYGKCYATSRCPKPEDIKPSSKGWTEGTVNNDEVAKFMDAHISVDDNNYGAAAEMVYRLLTYPLTYTEFSTVALDDSNSSVQTDVNIEFIHNNIHYWAGGDGGHMSQIPVATFDPIFWLHHCNIDRIFAIWQSLNPDKWFTSSKQGEFDQKIIGIKETDLVTNKTPLRPFHKDKAGNVWTPDEVRDHVPLGYTYEEIQPWKAEFQKDGRLDRDAYVKSIKKSVNDKYGKVRGHAVDILQEATGSNGAGGGQGGQGGQGRPAMAIAIATASPDGGPATAIAKAYSGGSSSNQASFRPVPGGMKVVQGGKAIESNDFALSVRFSRFAFGGHPFSINVYLGAADGSQAARNPETDYIGSVYNFSRPAIVDGQEVCSNCTTLQQDNVKMSAYLPVNPLLSKLLKEESLQSLEKEDVSRVLGRLYWRAIRYGKEVPADQLSALDLQIIVSINTATHFEDPAEASGFANFVVIPSLGFTTQSNANSAGSSSGSSDSSSGSSSGSGGGSSGFDLSQAPSDTQYLAIDKTVKLKKAVATNGSVTVQSASINLTPSAGNTEDSTGISFMYFDDSSNQDKYNEDNYDVLLSISIRRRDRKLRLNSKPARMPWHNPNNLDLNNNWFRTSTPKIEVKDVGQQFQIWIDDALITSMQKRIPGKPITHAQYWVKNVDLVTSALSYALTVKTQ